MNSLFNWTHNNSMTFYFVKTLLTLWQQSSWIQIKINYTCNEWSVVQNNSLSYWSRDDTVFINERCGVKNFQLILTLAWRSATVRANVPHNHRLTNIFVSQVCAIDYIKCLVHFWDRSTKPSWGTTVPRWWSSMETTVRWFLAVSAL